MTSRGPLTLAALASAAVPGLDPESVEAVRASGPADTLEVAFIQDREHRRWVIRCPRTPAASAQLERSAALLAVLARRLTMPVPAVKGWAALPEGGRAAVHAYLTGRVVRLEGITAGSELAKGLGRALAHLHNLDPRAYEEAGVPVYDAVGYRSRRLAELDRVAATGRVPTGLLTRWERVLDDESLWSFTATPTHGGIAAETILATPDDGTTPEVKAFLGWESAQVADPADDIAPLLAEMDSSAFDTVIEAYAHTRVERPDRNLHRRAEIIGEMQLVRTMMALLAAGEEREAERIASRLRRLDDRFAREEEAHVAAEDDTGPVVTGAAAAAATAAVAGTTPAAGDAADAETEDAAMRHAPATTVTQEIHLRSPQRWDDAQGSQDSEDPDDRVQPDEPKQPEEPEQLAAPEQPEAPAAPDTVARPERWDEDEATDEDDAVQVEHPATVTPVAAGNRRNDENGENDEDEGPARASGAAQDADAQEETGDDRDDVTPIGDDGDDDVVPPHPRP